MLLRSFLITIIYLFIHSCQVTPTDTERKIIGAWIIENVENPQLNSDFHSGFLLSFTKEKVFQPRNGQWKIIKENDNILIKINSKLSGISGKFSMSFHPQETLRPSEVILQSIDPKKESYKLTRMENQLENFL